MSILTKITEIQRNNDADMVTCQMAMRNAYMACVKKLTTRNGDQMTQNHIIHQRLIDAILQDLASEQIGRGIGEQGKETPVQAGTAITLDGKTA